jgi:small subunit ribosomal protein S3
MIERQFVAQKIKELQIHEFICETLKNIGHSHTKLQRTPLGDKVIIYASRPGMVVGTKGQNIKKLTLALKKKFGLENPQIEVGEVGQMYLDAHIVAEIITSSLEKFGTARFKGIGHKVMTDVMNAGALGIEIFVSGKIPSTRAKSWRFYKGYLKKSGDASLMGVDRAYATAQLKSGTVGVKVSIMPPTIELPDNIRVKEEQPAEEKPEQMPEEEKKEKSKKGKGKKKPKKETEEEKAEEQ